MTQTLKKFAIVAPILLAAAGAARAQDVFTFSAFGTVSGVQTDTDNAEFVASSIQPAGANRSADFEVDSKIGVQGVLRFGKSFSATLQALAKRSADDKFDAAAERGYLKYAYEDALSFRVGRIGLPLFMLVDNRDIGFASPGVRLPVEVYGSLPISSFDGLDLSYRERLGGTTFILQALGGKFKADFPPALRNTVVEADTIFGVDLSAESGSFSARAGVFRAELSIDSAATNALVTSLRALLPAVAPTANALADKIEIKKDPSTFFGVGAAFDNGTVLVRSEYTKLVTEGDGAGNWHSSYATFAVRFGKWQPSATYSTIRPDVTLQNTLTGGLFPQQVAGVNAFLAANKFSQNTTSYALRYDAYKNLAAKLQVDQIKADKAANLFVNRKLAFDGTATVYTLAVDFQY